MQYDENAEKYGYEGEMTPMKCDELKAYKGDVYIPVYGSIADAQVYLKEDVDATIAELKEALRDHCTTCPVKMQEDDAVAELKNENRRMKRALWHAIALFCARSCEYFNGIMSHCLIGQEDLYKRCEEKKNKYLHAMYKCRKKEEEYK